PEARDRFVELDLQIWNPFLQTKPGFIRKAIWLDRNDDHRIIVLVEWSDHALWKTITPTEVATITQQFDTQFATPYQLVISRELQPIS
ncbi:MAG: TIGR03792 family protein, partial [Oscillatoriales cyanobacterium]